ncbi:MAG: hypothetical protein U0521_24360 [Anaerolineae bacterium]
MVAKDNDTLNDKAEQVAEDATKTVAELGRELHHHADNVKSDMVKTLYEAAKTLRKESREAGAGEEVQERLDDVATGFEKAAGYLKRNSYSDIGEDAVRTAKNNPMQTMALIFIIGVVIGLLLRGNRSGER